LVPTASIKQNNTAKEGDLLFLTKRIGVGILTTAEKKGLLKPGHEHIAAEQMMQLNKAGEALGKISSVHAMTDVTGFGLLGHLIEMAEGSELSAEINIKKVPLITPDLIDYINMKAGGTYRNLENITTNANSTLTKTSEKIFSQMQTSGGLLIAVGEEEVVWFVI
jgi:selenide,water dikinase